MSIPIPLSVRLRASSRLADIDITRQIRDLTFRWTDPGGYASCKVSLSRPLILTPDEIQYYGRLVVFDGRNARPVWDGRLEDPGRSTSDGPIWDLAAVGGQAHTRDSTLPLIYVQKLAGGDFEKAATNAPGGTVNSGDDPNNASKDALILQFPQGQGINTGSRVNGRYSAVARAGQKLALLGYAWDAGSTDANMLIQAIASTGGGVSETPGRRRSTLRAARSLTGWWTRTGPTAETPGTSGTCATPAARTRCQAIWRGWRSPTWWPWPCGTTRLARSW